MCKICSSLKKMSDPLGQGVMKHKKLNHRIMNKKLRYFFLKHKKWKKSKKRPFIKTSLRVQASEMVQITEVDHLDKVDQVYSRL